VIPTRFRFIDLRARATAARDEHCERKCSFAHAGLIIDRATQRIRIARISSPGGKE
jgi:hypothetical protein